MSNLKMGLTLARNIIEKGEIITILLSGSKFCLFFIAIRG
jgi:hypothetical protein